MTIDKAAPPENDDNAIKLGNKIRQWIKDNRLDPNELKTDGESNVQLEDDNIVEDGVQKQDKEEKSKKKRGRFGFLKK